MTLVSSQVIDTQCIGGVRIFETLLPRVSALGTVGPFFHITGIAIGPRSALALVVGTLGIYALSMVGLVTLALDGADADTIYWIAPGAETLLTPSVCACKLILDLPM